MTLRCATTSSAIARLPLSKLLAVFLFGLSFAIQPNEGWAVPTSAKLQVYQCPKWLNVSPFYVKYVDANGLPILGSVRVSNLALIRAGVIVIEMLSARPDIMSALKRAHVRVAVMASTALRSANCLPENQLEYEGTRRWFNGGQTGLQLCRGKSIAVKVGSVSRREYIGARIRSYHFEYGS